MLTLDPVPVRRSAADYTVGPPIPCIGVENVTMLSTLSCRGYMFLGTVESSLPTHDGESGNRGLLLHF